MYKKYPCTHLYRVATYKMCTAGIHLFAQSPSRTAALRPPYSSPEDQRRRWQCNRFCSNPAWRQSSELGYPGKDNHKLIIAKIRFFLLTKGRSVVKEQVWDFLCCVVGKQVVWWQCKANKTGSSLLLQMDTPTHPAVVIWRYDKCEKYNEQHQNEKW